MTLYGDECFYYSADGEWTKCDTVFVGMKDQKGFLESTHFLVDSATPVQLVVRLVIKIEG